MLFLCFLSTPIVAQTSSFGRLPYQWSKTTMEDFQDYTIRKLNQQSALVNDFWLSYWLQQRVLTLNLGNPTPISHNEVLLLKGKQVNAYALPGNIIGLYSGLINQTQNEDQLASVLAHEIAHISLDHFTRSAQTRENQSLKILAALTLAIIVSTQNPSIGNATTMTALANATQTQLNFSQAMEIEADQLAHTILANSQYQPNAGGHFLFALNLSEGGSRQYEYLRTHPLGQTRAAKLSHLADQAAKPAQASFLYYQGYLRHMLDKTIALPIMAASEFKADNAEQRFIQWLSQNQHQPIHLQDLGSLQQIAQAYPSFLPARFYALKLSDRTAPNYCYSLQTFEQQLKQYPYHLTLDLIAFLTEASSHCQFLSAHTWHALHYWQSGQEALAIRYLKHTIHRSEHKNLVATLHTQLNRYLDRLQRFR